MAGTAGKGLNRKSFGDHENKRGKVGDKVVSIHDEKAEIKTVKEITSKGISGTTIHFVEGGSGMAYHYKIIKQPK